MSSITITWTYPPDAQHASHTADPILVSALKERDPTETSLLAGKARSGGGGGELTLSAELGDGQYMEPSLCKFLCRYVQTGELQCPHDAELYDCMLGALRVLQCQRRQHAFIQIR
jgi:hypothetical protein